MLTRVVARVDEVEEGILFGWSDYREKERKKKKKDSIENVSLRMGHIIHCGCGSRKVGRIRSAYD